MKASLPKGILFCELARTLALDFVLIFLFFLSFPTLCSSFFFEATVFRFARRFLR